MSDTTTKNEQRRRNEITAKIAEDAAKILERDGWCQGTARDEAGRRCAVGAITRAYYELLSEQRMDSYDCMRTFDGIERRLELESLGRYNDADGRTAEQVIAKLRYAAKLFRELDT